MFLLNHSFDIAIVGAGAFGSSCAYHLSFSGKKVLVLDLFQPPHSMGSSHGLTRIIREAYFEGPHFVPLVQQAYLLWDKLEKSSSRKLLLSTGGLMIGNPNGKVVNGALQSAQSYGLPFEYLDNKDIIERFPAFRPGPGDVGVYEQRAGILFPEQCIQTHLELASRSGNITFQFNSRVTGLEETKGIIRITTSAGVFEAARVVLSAGAWMNDLLPGFELPLTVARQPLYWFNPGSVLPQFSGPDRHPVYIWELADQRMIYGFPNLGDGIKIAFHHGGRQTSPGTLEREVSPEELAEITAVLKEHFHLEPEFSRSSVCMYTNTTDEGFILDFHPFLKNLIIASPCSGHGFKFSSSIGKILSDMALGNTPELDISAFSLSRFVGQ